MKSLVFVTLAVLSGGLFGCAEVRWTASIPIPSPDLSQVSEESLMEAISAARDAVAKAPRSAATWARLGHVYEIHDWHAEAAQCYQRAADLEPKEWRWLYYLGRSFESVDAEKAVSILRRAVALDDTHAPLHISLAAVLRNLGRETEVAQHLVRAKQLDPGNPRSDLWLGQLALAGRRYSEARDDLSRAIELNPGQSEAHQSISQVYLALGDRDAARRHAELALRPSEGTPLNDPLWGEVQFSGATRYWYRLYAGFFRERGDYARAVSFYDKGTNGDEPNPMYWYNYGNALKKIGQSDRAVQMYLRGLEASRAEHQAQQVTPEQRWRLHNNLGICYQTLNDTARAEEHWREAISIEPATTREPRYNLAQLYARQGRLREAIELLEGYPGVADDSDLAPLLKRLYSANQR